MEWEKYWMIDYKSRLGFKLIKRFGLCNRVGLIVIYGMILI